MIDKNINSPSGSGVMDGKVTERQDSKSKVTIQPLGVSSPFETLMNAQNGQFITIKTRTDVKLNKRGNPLKDAKVEKISTRNCQWGISYENSVNNRLEKKGEERTFVAESLPWGEWKVANKVIEHKGAIYYRFYVVKNAKVESTYYVDGVEATPEQMLIINQFMPKTYEASNGVDVMPFNVKEENILSVKANNMYWTKEKVSLAA